jgi:hypothetical protein
MGDRPWDKNNSRSEQAFFLMLVSAAYKHFSNSIILKKKLYSVKNIVGLVHRICAGIKEFIMFLVSEEKKRSHCHYMGGHPWDKNNSRSEQAFFLMSVSATYKHFSNSIIVKKKFY